MRLIHKLCGFSSVYGLLFYFVSYCLFNPYKLEIITSWSFDKITTVFLVIFGIIVLLATFFIPIATKKLLLGSFHSLWTSILWIPFFILLMVLIPALIPSLYPQLDPEAAHFESDNYVGDIIAIVLFLICPVYLLITTSVGIWMKKRNDFKPA